MVSIHDIPHHVHNPQLTPPSFQATNTPPLIPIPQKYLLPNLPPNLGTLAALSYSSLYVLLEPVAGSAFAVLIMLSTAGGNLLTSTYGSATLGPLATIHILSWIAQFIGHGKFEGRAPALLDNLVQALFLAPLFVWLEILFSLGYREELKTRLDRFVAQDIAKFKAKKAEAAEDGTTNGGPLTRSQKTAATSSTTTTTNGHAKSG